ncbi:hypothetical protein SCACP_36880 [Sporomusa carbonis]|uniref:(2Fe-2S)-binding protein n=1 Tax=Sporomusa carbonis TaxID=3076075 RepID=UPI003A6A0C29
MSKNCCSASCCQTPAAKCPACGASGQKVPFETVKNMVRNDVPDSEAFGVCLAADCDVVYFSPGRVFRQSDVRVPIAWKDGATPKYVCYCNRVTEDEIIHAVAKNGARTVSDVAKATGAMKNGNCIANNPKGACCHKDIESVIHRSLESK